MCFCWSVNNLSQIFCKYKKHLLVGLFVSCSVWHILSAFLMISVSVWSLSHMIYLISSPITIPPMVCSLLISDLTFVFVFARAVRHWLWYRVYRAVICPITYFANNPWFWSHIAISHYLLSDWIVLDLDIITLSLITDETCFQWGHRCGQLRPCLALIVTFICFTVLTFTCSFQF